MMNNKFKMALAIITIITLITGVKFVQKTFNNAMDSVNNSINNSFDILNGF